jgi:hypothetical protein
MDCTKLSKKDAIEQLINYIHKAQAGGAYGIDEGKILDTALGYFDPNRAPEDREKLTNDNRDQTAVAWDVLKQAVHVGQRRGGAYQIRDAAIIFDLLTHVEKLRQQPEEEESKTPAAAAKKKSKVDKVLPPVDELDEESHSEVEEMDVPQQRTRRHK